MGSPLYFDIIYITSPQKVDMPHFDTYNGKGDPMTYVNSFQTLCTNFSHDYRFMTKFFTRVFKDKSLQWYCSLTANSIDSFQKISNYFIPQFQRIFVLIFL